MFTFFISQLLENPFALFCNVLFFLQYFKRFYIKAFPIPLTVILSPTTNIRWNFFSHENEVKTCDLEQQLILSMLRDLTLQ